MRYPSIKKLQEIPGIGPAEAQAIRHALKWGHFEAEQPWTPIGVEDWVRSCYHQPRRLDVAHAICAHIITEGRDISWDVMQDQSEWASYHEGPSWEAVNVGDTYIPTLCRKNGNYRVCGWGDL